MRCLLLVFVLLAAGCARNGDHLDVRVETAQSDVERVANALNDLTTVKRKVVVDRCRNTGSGPVAPTTVIYMQLKEGSRVDAVRRETISTLQEIGYTVTGGDSPALVVAKRHVDTGGALEVSLYDSPSSIGELILSTSITPAISC